VTRRRPASRPGSPPWPREAVRAFGGEVIELRGDEALAVFDSARQAIRTAVELQRRFVDQTVADPELPLAVRIGLDAGEAVPVDGGYRGGALNLAARLCSMAGPAEILASREVVHLARKVDGITSVDRGPVRLKGLAEPVHVVRLRAEAEDAADDMAFRRALGPSAARLVPVVPGTMVPNPYKGLRPFGEGDAEDFFGREELTRQLVHRLGQTRFLAVIGPSGSGKSSVVRAGLLPALRRGALPGSSEWRIAEMLPGAHPLEELEAALLRVAANPPASLIEQLQEDERGLLRAAKRILPPGDTELLLLIDQFEELFTLVADEGIRTHFLESLEAAVTDPNGRLRVVVTLRADFYDRPLLYRGFAELLRSRVEVVVPLSPDELERAIAGPAKRVDVRLEPGLVAQMLADVANEPGALPLLEYALTELFERREGNVLTVNAYREIGGVSGALGRRAEELFDGLDAQGREAARQLFLRLVSLGEGTEDTRRPVPRSDLVSLQVDQQAMATSIDGYGASRLLSFDRDSRSGAPTVEVAHEALLTAWGRLRRWIDEAREDLRTERRLATAAREWIEGDRDPSFLVGGSRLDQYLVWQQGGGISMTPEEREFLEASAAERDRRRTEDEARDQRERALERRSVTRLRALVAVLTVAALIAAGLTVFAFDQRGRARSEGRVAVGRELAAAALANLDSDPERSILLALEAVDRTRSADGRVLPEVENALHDALVASRVVLTVPGLGGALDWSADGKLFVTEGPEETGVVDIRDARTGASLRSFKGHDVDLNFVAFSADGTLLATTGDDGAIRVWNANTGQRVAELMGPNSPVVGPSFSPDGSLVAASWVMENEVRVFDLATQRVVHLIDTVPSPFATTFSPDGQRLAVASNEDAGTVVFDVRSGGKAFALEGQFGTNDVDWSPDGRWIATAANDGTARIWNAESGTSRFTILGHTGSVFSVDWAPDSTRVATGGNDGAVKIWEITDDGPLERLALSSEEMASGVWGVAFSPEGDRVMAGALDITVVKVWDVSRTGDAEWRNLPGTPFGFNSVAFDPNGRLVTSGPDGSVQVWDISRQEPDLTLSAEDPDSGVETVDPNPDGEAIAAIVNGEVHAWDARIGHELFTMASDQGFIEDLAWSPVGDVLATAWFEEEQARIFDRSGKPVAELTEEPGFGVWAVRFSADGTLVAGAGWPKGRPLPNAQHVTIWDWRRNEVVRTIRTPVDALAFDPARPHIAVANLRGGEIWNLEDGTKVVTLAGESGSLVDITYSPDGSLIAAAGVDATVRLWDASTGVQLLVLRGHDVVVSDVDFSPDGSQLASGSPDGTIRVWALDLDDLIELAKSELTRGLTAEECLQYLHGPCPRS
jgi:WD40 repeat protein